MKTNKRSILIRIKLLFKKISNLFEKQADIQDEINRHLIDLIRGYSEINEKYHIFEMIFTYMPFGLYVVDMDSDTIIYVNDYFRDKLGDVVGQERKDVFKFKGTGTKELLEEPHKVFESDCEYKGMMYRQYQIAFLLEKYKVRVLVEIPLNENNG